MAKKGSQLSFSDELKPASGLQAAATQAPSNGTAQSEYQLSTLTTWLLRVSSCTVCEFVCCLRACTESCPLWHAAAAFFCVLSSCTRPTGVEAKSRTLSSPASAHPTHGYWLQEEQAGNIDSELATVISSIALACKQISSLVTRSGISNLTGAAGGANFSVRHLCLCMLCAW